MELRVDHNLTTADQTATLQDIYDLHNAAPDADATGSGVTVAVMDTGIDASHPVFSDTTIAHHDFTGSGSGDEVGHGTGVASLVTQLAPGADIVSLRVFGDSGRTGMKPISEAYEWLIDHADQIDVCNFSWGASSTIESVNRLHRRALDAGIQDVVAAGNTGERGGSPATTTGAFSIGALTEGGDVTRFSSYNPDRDNPDVAAIGKDVKLARAEGTSMGRVIDENWVKASGTSFASPITAGLVARYLSKRDGDPLKAFEKHARDIAKTPEDGEGIVDYARTMGDQRKKKRAKTSAMVRDLLGIEFVTLNDADWFDSGTYTAVRLDDQTIRLKKDSKQD